MFKRFQMETAKRTNDEVKAVGSRWMETASNRGN